MAQADLLVDLLKTATSGDQLAFRKAAEGLIQEEKQKGHRLLAERLTKALQASAVQPVRPPAARANGSSAGKDLFYEITPERNLSSLVLPEKIRNQVIGSSVPGFNLGQLRTMLADGASLTCCLLRTDVAISPITTATPNTTMDVKRSFVIHLTWVAKRITLTRHKRNHVYRFDTCLFDTEKSNTFRQFDALRNESRLPFGCTITRRNTLSITLPSCLRHFVAPFLETLVYHVTHLL